jgi:hypothetical protein
VEALQTLFLAGNVPGLLVKDCAVLSVAAVVLFALIRINTRKQLV